MSHNILDISDMLYIKMSTMPHIFELWTSLLYLIILRCHLFVTQFISNHGHNNEVKTSLFSGKTSYFTSSFLSKSS